MESEKKKKLFLAAVEEVLVDADGNIISLEEEIAPAAIEPTIDEVEEVEEVVAEEATEEEIVEEPVEEEAAEEEVVEEAAEEEVVEEAAEEAVEEVAAAEAAFVAPIFDTPAAEKVAREPSPNFAQKVMRADEVIQDRYDELKNYALRFKKLKSRISKKFDSINKGRLHFVKLSVAGKTLKLYLNMNINETEPKFHCKDMSDKKTYVTVPVLLRIKSGRAVRYAKILIDQCAEFHGLVENKKFVEVDAMKIIEDAVAKKNADNDNDEIDNDVINEIENNEQE